MRCVDRRIEPGLRPAARQSRPAYRKNPMAVELAKVCSSPHSCCRTRDRPGKGVGDEFQRGSRRTCGGALASIWGCH